jgi:hypothetical protein
MPLQIGRVAELGNRIPRANIKRAGVDLLFANNANYYKVWFARP